VELPDLQPLGVPCKQCKEKEAIVNLPAHRLKLCKECFEAFFENRVKRTVKSYRMFGPGQKVGVLLSGGKDSSALLVALKQAFPEINLLGIHINLGIGYHSEQVEDMVKELCERWKVPLFVYNLPEEEGFSIDDFVFTQFKHKVCSACGVIKRYLFSVVAKRLELDAIATGHHLDDALSTMLNLFFQGDFHSLVRLSPVLPPLSEKQVKKVKPLFYTPEREIIYYAIFKDIPLESPRCPHAEGENIPGKKYREFLDFWEEKNPQFRYQALSVFLKKLFPILKKTAKREEEVFECKKCGEPTSSPQKICSRCRRVELIFNIKNRVLEFSNEEEAKKMITDKEIEILDVDALGLEPFSTSRRRLFKVLRPFRGMALLLRGKDPAKTYYFVLKLRKLGFQAYHLKGG
jgi:uncharacterized protein (TIGR00269 family)